MPELPEVETVARDLRPRIVGATIVGARCSLGADRCARTTPEAFAEAVAGRTGRGGRPAREADRRRPVRRRRADDPPQDDRPAVRRPGRHARGPVRPARPRAGRRPRAAVPRHPQVRADRAVRPRPGDGRARDRGRRRRGLRGDRPGAARPTRSRCASSGAGCAGGRAGSSRCCSTSRSSPGSATSTPTRRCGRRGSTRCGSAATLRPPDERHLYEAIRSILAEAVERRGSSIDDYTAPDGDGSMQERLQVYQRTGEPCPRCGRPIKRIVVGARSTHFCSWCQRLPAADRKGAARDPADDDRRRRPARPALDGAGGRGEPRADAGRGGPRQRPASRTERTKRAAATRRAAARARRRPAPGPA